MHPRIQAKREAEAAASIDAAADAIAKRHGVDIEAVAIATKDARLKQLFQSERTVAVLKGVLKVSRSTDRREKVALTRIEGALDVLGKELQPNEDADPAMRACWYLEELANILESLAGVENPAPDPGDLPEEEDDETPAETTDSEEIDAAALVEAFTEEWQNPENFVADTEPVTPDKVAEVIEDKPAKKGKGK